MRILRYILLPVVPVYWLVTWFRNWLYDHAVLSSMSYVSPIICVGNLSTGGTGKTPMVEYLIKILKPQFRVATLSRGYKRKSKGFKLATNSTRALEIGDEPFQFFKNHSDILVAVDENRQNGIENLLKNDNPPEIILLDDAFQHRKVKAGLNILLTTFNNLYSNDMVLPTGNLREPKNGSSRAQIIVVTKCPELLTNQEKIRIGESLRINKDQHLFFSRIAYATELSNGSINIPIDELELKKFTLITGVANPDFLVTYLKSRALNFDHLKFADHHNFTNEEIAQLKNKEIILTTEKDFVRLSPHFDDGELYYIAIETIIEKDKEFNKLILNFCDS